MNFNEICKMYEYLNTYDIVVNLSYIFDITQTQARLKKYSPKEVKKINKVFKQLKQGKPIQYVVKNAYFFSRNFFVKSGVLIPRFDTEFLVNQAYKLICENNLSSCLDMCCGSGIIGITLNLESKVNTTCADISLKALKVAKKNAKKHKAKVKFVKSNLFKNIKQKFDIIVSNPPYIPSSEIEKLDDVVKNYEPHLALDGSDDGLKFYRQIIEDSSKFLNKNGWLCFEVGVNQAQDVKELLKNKFKNVKIVKDYNNIERVVIGKLC